MEKGRKNILPLMGIEAQFFDLESCGMLPQQLSSCSVVRYGHAKNGFTPVHLRARGVNVGSWKQTQITVTELKVMG
jgi:hypothetical protein